MAKVWPYHYQVELESEIFEFSTINIIYIYPIIGMSRLAIQQTYAAFN